MANATSRVGKNTVRRHDEFIKRSAATLAAQTQFFTNAMLGLTTGGYLAKLDDTQSLLFFGLVRGREGDPKLPIGTAGDEELGLDAHQPFRFELQITGVAVTDIGKKVYASDDQTGTLASTTTFGNLIGTVVDVVATNVALVEPAYDGHAGNKRLGAVRVMAATGNQTIARWDVGKTILVPNTGALTLLLPAVATVQTGAEICFVKTNAAAEIITLDGFESETIDGSATNVEMDANHDTITLVADGTNWRIKAKKIA